jgi:hypothetical protein
MELPPPLCCSIPFFKNNCEKSTCCNVIGKIGFKYFDENRHKTMLFAAAMTFLATILSIVALTAISTSSDTVKNTNWTYGESDTTKYWIGLEKLVVKTNGKEISQNWNHVNCGNDSYCDDCYDACNTAYSFAIINLITCLPTLMTDLQRSTAQGDLNCQKFMGMLTGLVGFISNLSSLSAYANSCYSNLPSTDSAGDDIVFRLGPGFICILIATMLKPIDFFIHLLTPVAEKDKELVSNGNKVEDI